MPTYEYACKSCGEHLEVFQSFTDQALTTCPACGGALRKVFGNIGISFKGSGFYKTDSRAAASANGSNGKGRGKAASEAAGSSGSSDGSESGSGSSGSSATSGSAGASGSSGSGSSGSGSGSGKDAAPAA